MRPSFNPCAFAAAPLDRASERRADPDWLAARRADPESRFLPLVRGDPLCAEGPRLQWLTAAAAPAPAPCVFLGLDPSGRAAFAFDASALGAERFAGLGAVVPLREAAAALGADDLAVAGQARWLLDWHRRHTFCARCGADTALVEGGAKRLCGACGAEHFPRADPVAIVLAVCDDACLLGRSPHFPPGFYSALAGYVEAGETPEACAVRELREEAGVVLTDVDYRFSQPWPFPSSLMMGFLATAESQDLVLDGVEVVDAVWLPRADAEALAGGARREDVRLPPGFTIARRLIEDWLH